MSSFNIFFYKSTFNFLYDEKNTLLESFDIVLIQRLKLTLKGNIDSLFFYLAVFIIHFITDFCSSSFMNIIIQ